MLSSPTKSCQSGVGLIEVLVTILVVAIGLLSAAALQTISKKIHFEAVERSVAAQLMQDISQRMRANSRNLNLYTATDATVSPEPTTNCLAEECNGAELAAYDLYQWGQALLGATETDDENQKVGGLAFPTGCIRANAAPNQYEIVLTWRGTSARPKETGDDTCGDSKVAYSDPDGTTGNTMKRFMKIRTYIAP